MFPTKIARDGSCDHSEIIDYLCKRNMKENSLYDKKSLKAVVGKRKVFDNAELIAMLMKNRLMHPMNMNEIKNTALNNVAHTPIQVPDADLMQLADKTDHHLIERLVELNAKNAKGTPVFSYERTV